MVDRATQRPGLPGRGQAQIQVGGVNFAAPDVNKFQNEGGRDTEIGKNLHAQEQAVRLLGSLATFTGAMAKQEFSDMTQEAYLKGAVAAGKGLTEDQLETNLLTANWSKAGYRDTVGRMAMTKRQAQILEDLPKLAEQSPEAMQRYLDRSRTALEPQLAGMSRQARQTLFGELLTMDASAMKAYGTERAKYIVGAQTDALAAGAQTQVAALDSARGDLSTYAVRTQEAMTWAHSNIVMNPNLPAPVKQKLLGQYLSYAVSQNHMGLYDAARTQQVPLEDGTTRTMLQMLPIDEQEKLGEAYQKALKGTEAIRNQEYLQRHGVLLSALNDEGIPLPAEGQVRAFIQEGLNNGSLSASEVTSLSQKYASARRKQQNNAAIVSATLAGNYQELGNLGATQQEGLSALKKQWQQQNVPLPSRIQTLASMGLRGSLPAFSEMSSYAQPALTQIMAGQTPDEASAGALEQIMRTTDEAEQGGRKGAHALLVSGMPEDMRDMYLDIQEGLRSTDMTTAISRATAKQAQFRGMSSDVKRAMANSDTTTKENQALVDSVGTRGVFATAWRTIKGVVSSDARMRNEIEPFEAPLFADPIVAERAASVKRAYQEELAFVTAQNPTLSADARDTKALAAVHARTVPLDNGSLVLPRGMNAQQFFGVPSNVGTERLGQALSELATQATPTGPGAPAATRMYVTTQGTLMLESYNSNGDLQASQSIDTTSVAGVIQRQREQEGAVANQEYGGGVTVTDPTSKVSVQFNGVNTASVDPGLMLDFRKTLVKHEGVRSSTYSDGAGGAVSGGVAVNSGNDYFPKDGRNREWTQFEIDDTFRMASNAAAIAATRAQRNTGLAGADSFKLFGELAYQVGPAWYGRKDYAPLITALQAGDRAQALEAFRGTTAYKASGSTRRSSYEALISNLTE